MNAPEQHSRRLLAHHAPARDAAKQSPRIPDGSAQRPCRRASRGKRASRRSGARACRSPRSSACATTTRRAGRRSSTSSSSWPTRAICRSCSTATPATATSTTCAVWCRSSSSAASRACASRTSSSRRPTASSTAKRQPLADIDEFCGKIKAGKDSQSDPNFSIVARVEALIAGWGMEEALQARRGVSPGGRGRDPDPQQAVEARRDPDVRARVGRPRSARHRADEVLQHADRRVPSGRHQHRDLGEPSDARRRVRDAGRREGNPRQRDARQRRRPHRVGERDLPSAGRGRVLGRRAPLSVAAGASRAAVVLAASRGAGLEAVTDERPKVMLPIAGKPLLRRLVDAFKKEGINDITVVGGYRADAIETAGIRLVVNERYARPASWRRSRARSSARTDTVISYGDLLFRSYILRDLVETDATSRRRRFVADAGSKRTVRDFAYCSTRRRPRAVRQEGVARSVSSAARIAPSGARRKAAGSACSTCAAGARERLLATLDDAAAARRFRHARHGRAAERADRRGREDRSAVRARPLARRERSRRLPSRGRFRARSDADRTSGTARENARDRGRQFVEAARERGFDWYAGVPCSYLTPFINYVLQDDRCITCRRRTKAMRSR